MRLVIIPPYKRVGVTEYTRKEGHFVVREMIDNMAKKGQLEGVEIDIAEPYPCENPTEARDEEFSVEISPGIIKRVREYSEMGKYDAIVTNGAFEPGFFAAREICKIPIAGGPHSAMHIAALLGERFSIIELRDTMALMLRHLAQIWGLSGKLASIRTIGRTSTYILGLIHKYRKEERIKAPECKKLIDDAVAQGIAAIEKDRADTLVLGCIPLQCFEAEIRQGLDEAGYDEIQMVVPVYAGVEMAKAMVNMKLISAPRAYPSDQLKAKPEFR